jgi:hypothetical protein
VAVGNLTGVWRNARGTPFPTQFASGGESLHVEDGRIYGNLTVTSQGAVTLNPQTIGLSSVGSVDLKLNSAPVAIRPGLTTQIAVGGDTGIATLKMMLVNMKEGGFISDHDYEISSRIAEILCGGEVEPGSMVDEKWLLDLERRHFVALAKTPKTQERIEFMLKNGKPLRN